MSKIGISGNVNKLKEIKKNQYDTLVKYGADVSVNGAWNDYKDKFEILINGGALPTPSEDVPKEYHISKIITHDNLNVSYNEEIFLTKITESGDYRFTYNQTEDQWKLFDVDNVNLSDYGLNLEDVSTLEDGNSFKVCVYDKYCGWQYPEDWYDIKTILENDTSGYKKIILMLNDTHDDITITLSNYFYNHSYPKIARTSDGGYYESSSNGTDEFTHTWIKSADKPTSKDGNVRWIMLYYQYSTDPNYYQDYIQGNYLKISINRWDDVVSIAAGANFTEWELFSDSNTTLKALDFVEGANCRQNSTRFLLQNCYALEHIDNNPNHYDGYVPNITEYSGKTPKPWGFETSLNPSNNNYYSPTTLYLNTIDINNLSSANIFSTQTSCFHTTERVEGVLDLSELTGTTVNIFHLYFMNLKHCKIILPSQATTVNLFNSFSEKTSKYNFGDDESFEFLAKYAPVVSGTSLKMPLLVKARLEHCQSKITYNGEEYTPYNLLLAKGWVIN